MVILGAGLTGCLAAHAFKNAVIHEYLDTPNTHKAVLRFRSDEIAQLTGIPFKKVNVQKGIIYNGKYVEPNIEIINRYSKKVTGGVHSRSIIDTSDSVRYIAPCDFHERMLDRLDGRVITGSQVDIDCLKRPIISTIPLPALLGKLGEESISIPKQNDARPVYVTTVNLENCDVYQTVYDCSTDIPVYRASITGDRLIIESVCKITEGVIRYICNMMAVEPCSIIEQNTKQEYGKFIPLPDKFRQDMMYDITNTHNIYSLGRHATWRKVLLDDVAQDIKRIDTMMKTSAYNRMLGKTL